LAVGQRAAYFPTGADTLEKLYERLDKARENLKRRLGWVFEIHTQKQQGVVVVERLDHTLPRPAHCRHHRKLTKAELANPQLVALVHAARDRVASENDYYGHNSDLVEALQFYKDIP
jgi:hypothetical protein